MQNIRTYALFALGIFFLIVPSGCEKSEKRQMKDVHDFAMKAIKDYGKQDTTIHGVTLPSMKSK